MPVIWGFVWLLLIVATQGEAAVKNLLSGEQVHQEVFHAAYESAVTE
jgi:hypothetical protein